MTINELEKVAHELRLDILKMFYKSGRGHLAPALSCVDILTALYFLPVIDLKRQYSEERDRVILSKGHACAALYAVLARAGYYDKESLREFYQDGSYFGGHPHSSLPGVEAATGSLGHGICFGTGTALAAKLQRKPFWTYVILGDGESEEGSVWEAAMFAGNHALDNLTVVLDYNRLQGNGFVADICPLEPVAAKWESFGWKVFEVDGHDFHGLAEAFQKSKLVEGVPTLLVAHTVKGQGVEIAENAPAWHSRAPQGDEWQAVCEEYGIAQSELEKL